MILSERNNVNSGLYRHRCKTTPKLPDNKAEVRIEGPWTETTDGRSFLAINDGEEDKLLVFTTDDDIRRLSEADKIYMDGTFTVCPNLWSQLYVMHAMVGNVMYPLVYALMPNRRQQTYERLFGHVKDLVMTKTGQPLIPDCLQVDFEAAAINAIGNCFPDSSSKGCYFHYAQAIWRKTQNLGLATLYKEDEAVRQWIQRAATLAMLPPHHVQDTWREVMEETPDVPRSEDMNDYITATWVDFDAIFPLHLWNHHHTDGPRTNNHLEGWHAKLIRFVQKCHPNLFEFINFLKKIETTDRARKIQMDHGAAPPTKRRVYRQVDARIDRLKLQLQTGGKTPMQFIDAVGHLLKLR